MSVEVERVREGYCNFCASVRRRDGARAKDIDMVQMKKEIFYTSAAGEPLTIKFRMVACRDCLRRMGSMLKRSTKR